MTDRGEGPAADAADVTHEADPAVTAESVAQAAEHDAPANNAEAEPKQDEVIPAALDVDGLGAEKKESTEQPENGDLSVCHCSSICPRAS
jgi:hypothetical protein